jgi:hypothetical protein
MPPRKPITPVRLVFADEVRALVLLEDQRGDVGQLADAVDDREVNLRIIPGDRVDDGGLGEADADDQIEAALGERADCRLDVDRRARLDVSEQDAERRFPACGAVGQPAGLGAPHTGPRGCVERAIVLTADVEDDADAGGGRPLVR